MKLETLLVHAALSPPADSGAVADSIQLSTTFVHGPAGERAPAGFEYQRGGHPNALALESALTAIEGGAAALSFASGMAAISALMHCLEHRGEVLIGTDVYQGTRTLTQDFLGPQGFVPRAHDHAEVESFIAAIGPATRMVWLETPSNPLLAVGDIAAVAAACRRHGALLVVDNTFATPVLQNPIALGADVVMHSTTKYFGGHSDALGGALIFARQDPLALRVLEYRGMHGAPLAPFNAWLTLRGLRTLAVRVVRHAANAEKVAEYLAGRPEVEQVNYPGLPGHRNHAIARLQMRGFGGMLSFSLRAGREAAIAVAGALKVFLNATSLGGFESLVEHRWSVEHPTKVSAENLLRLSIGLEHADDLIADLAQALDQL